ncbi:hypothetical protein EQZ23_10805 [Sphingomonas sp. UV9]|uniref:ParB/RepB/Spo0J family partition protein n=1 Tax=Sphingomonas sp. UV9 TaxID=1851410 RepID=UPI000FFB37F5|nr:ParB/RepB/Spo0J family partition protein [Sphingomonas sp. UV9]RXD05540.1 hypothetical protein EQZ23_10805 [Sphingomonas sp. UV9]
MASVTIEPQRGEMPILQFCTPAQLRVDPTYQRPTDAQASRTLINRITRHWDWRLYQPLVVARRADGGLYVVDGQHRLEAARQRSDIPQLPCVVTSYDGAQDEAAAFVSLNQQRKPLSKMNLFRAAIAAGDADAIAIEALVELVGLRITGAADVRTWKPGWINNVAAIQQCYRQHGEAVTRVSLEALAKGFPLAVLRNCNTMFGAIVPLVAQQGAALSAFLLHEILRDADQETWMSRFRDLATARSISVTFAAKQLLGESYAEAAAE